MRAVLVHYDIVLPAFDDRRMVHSDPLDDEDLAEAASDHLDPHVHRLLALFGDRHRK